MSPSKFHHANNDIANKTTTSNPNNNIIKNNNKNNGYNWVPPPLKINKNSHSIKKSSPSPPSSSSSSSFPKPPTPPPAPPQRHPVIIYTHSPKVIHTHPKDFMALVQKLTGLSHPDQDKEKNPNPNPNPNPRAKPEPGNSNSLLAPSEAKGKMKMKTLKDGVEESGITMSSSSCSAARNNGLIRSDHGGAGQLRMINSCYVSPQPPNNPCNLMNNIPVFASSSADFFCPNQPFYNYSDPFLFGGSNSMRSHLPSSPSTVLLEGLNEFREY